jgi:hypothetical protein
MNQKLYTKRWPLLQAAERIFWCKDEETIVIVTAGNTGWRMVEKSLLVYDPGTTRSVCWQLNPCL